MKKISKKPQSPRNSYLSKFNVGIGFLVIAAVATILIMVLPDSGKQSSEENLSYEFVKHGTAAFFDKDGIEICSFDIEIADTAETMSTGLMYRDSLAVNQAMLFLYEKPDILSFWMKNTYLPLDIIFIGPDSTIVSIGKETTPFSEASVVSKGPSQYVLEVNAGISDKFNLNIGDKFSWKRD
jgi:hypothetical protein